MNLLVVDATRDCVEFAVYAADVLQQELVLSGMVTPRSGEPMVVTDADGHLLHKTAVRAGVSKESCLCLLLQWIDARGIRVDAIANQERHGGDFSGLAYLQATYRGVPQVALPAAGDAEVNLSKLAGDACTALAIPRTCPTPKGLRVRCANCGAD